MIAAADVAQRQSLTTVATDYLGAVKNARQDDISPGSRHRLPRREPGTL